jgi:hypothetical protein
LVETFQGALRQFNIDTNGNLEDELDDKATWDEKNREDKIVRAENKVWGWDSTVSSVKRIPQSEHRTEASCIGQEAA